MTEAEAVNEAVLRFTRKMHRLHPAAFAEVWGMIPDGARDALALAERNADVVRYGHGIKNLAYPVEIEETED
jgi:hypothetical protein